MKNLFGVTLSQNVTAKLAHCVEDTDGAIVNCKPSVPSNRNKRELHESHKLSIVHIEIMLYDFQVGVLDRVCDNIICAEFLLQINLKQLRSNTNESKALELESLFKNSRSQSLKKNRGER